MRTALKDCEIRGRKIKEGDWVAVWNASVNRDEEVFANADHFDVARDPNDHFAFAYGEHFCLARIWRAWRSGSYSGDPRPDAGCRVGRRSRVARLKPAARPQADADQIHAAARRCRIGEA